MEAGLLEQVLEECWPLECDAVGPAIRNDILAGRRFEPTKAGSSVDLERTVTVLSAAVALVKNLMDIAVRIRDEQKRSPTAEEITASAKSPVDQCDAEGSVIDGAKRDEAARAIVRRLEDPK